MSKQITSNSKRWAGTVTLSDPLTIPQAQAIEAGLKPPQGGEDGKIWLSVIDANQLPAVIACVEKWELTGFPEVVTVDNFPASPRKESHAFIEWLFREILNIYSGEAEIPNA